jgi:hypothetical protein
MLPIKVLWIKSFNGTHVSKKYDMYKTWSLKMIKDTINRISPGETVIMLCKLGGML